MTGAATESFRSWTGLEELGIPRLEALKTVTRNPALALGLGRELGMIAAGYRANLVFAAGDITRGTLTAERIVRVIFHGETVVENRAVVASKTRGFRENSLSVFGLPYWDPLLSWLVGGNITDYDLFRTGVTASLDVMASIRNMWFANLALSVPSPIPRTALKLGAHFDNQNRLFYGIGNDTRLQDTTEYRNLIFKENLSATTRITQEWKANAALFFDQSKLSPYRYGPLPATVPGDSGGNEAIASLSLIHDTRDNINNPWYGHYVALTGQMAPAILPDGHSFQKVTFDARGFVSLLHKHILAGRCSMNRPSATRRSITIPTSAATRSGAGYCPTACVTAPGSMPSSNTGSRLPARSAASCSRMRPDSRIACRSSRSPEFIPASASVPATPRAQMRSSIIGVDAGFTREGWNLVLHAGHAF